MLLGQLDFHIKKLSRTLIFQVQKLTQIAFKEIKVRGEITYLLEKKIGYIFMVLH